MVLPDMIEAANNDDGLVRDDVLETLKLTDLMTFQLRWLVQFHIRLYCKVSQTEFECVG